MRAEQIKIFTSIVGLSAVFTTFYIFSTGFERFVLDKDLLVWLAVFASAYAGLVSVFISRRLERRRAQQKRIFVIHSREDADAAKEVVLLLRENGFNPWLDVEEILPGQRWDKAAAKALEESAVALFLASSNTQNRDGYYAKELKAAFEILQTKADIDSPVIPVRLEDVEMPEELAGVQWVDWKTDSGKESLLRGLSRVLVPPREATGQRRGD